MLYSPWYASILGVCGTKGETHEIYDVCYHNIQMGSFSDVYGKYTHGLYMKLPFWGQNLSYLVHNPVTVIGHSLLGQLSTLVHLRHSHTLVHFGQKTKVYTIE